MTRGFVTIATGGACYYRLAENLLLSYRRLARDPLPFAILCEEENRVTASFDRTILLERPAGSYLDKLELLVRSPFDETIFLDADCLAYRDIGDLWQYFPSDPETVFSAFGQALPLDSTEGWFTREGAGKYKDKIEFVTHLHGGLYFIRKAGTGGGGLSPLVQMRATCRDIVEKYGSFNFRMFDSPADEPVLALAMAVHRQKPVPPPPEGMCFYPCATRFEADIEAGRVLYSVPWFDGRVQNGAYLVHWGSYYCDRLPYLREAYTVRRLAAGKRVPRVRRALLGLYWRGASCAKKILRLMKHLLSCSKSKSI